MGSGPLWRLILGTDFGQASSSNPLVTGGALGLRWQNIFQHERSNQMPWPQFGLTSPFITHSDLIMPEPETVLWRYMDLTKLLYILGSGYLHFTRIDKFEDPFEGVPPRKALQGLVSRIRIDSLERVLQIRKRNHAVCWHANETESAAMWRLYLSANEGIAIKTTAQRLHDSIQLNHKGENELFLAEVQYIDHEDDSLDLENFIKWATFKRKSFEHEREVRLLKVAKDNEQSDDFCYRAKVNVNTLIESIYLGPLVPKWVGDVIDHAVTKYGPFEIKRSELGGDAPTYISSFIKKTNGRWTCL